MVSIDPSGTDVIVIQPGSRYMKIGFASQAFPYIVPHVLAKPSHKPEFESSDERNDWEIDEDQVQERITQRYKQARRKPPANIYQSMSNYNRQSEYEEISAHNDAFLMEWTDAKSSKCHVGISALHLNPGLPYKLVWPLQRGTFNSRDYSHVREIVEDLGQLWRGAIVQELHVNVEDFGKYCIVLVLPDSFERAQVNACVEALMSGQKPFKAVTLIQDSQAVTFGCGVSSAVVVDCGAQKISISCVEEGFLVPESRLKLSIGGDEITRVFAELLRLHEFPHEFDLRKPMDWELLDELKERCCTVNEAEIAPSAAIFEFYVRKPEELTKKFLFKMYEERLIAPLALFDPEMSFLSTQSSKAIDGLEVDAFDLEDTFTEPVEEITITPQDQVVNDIPTIQCKWNKCNVKFEGLQAAFEHFNTCHLGEDVCKYPKCSFSSADKTSMQCHIVSHYHEVEVIEPSRFLKKGDSDRSVKLMEVFNDPVALDEAIVSCLLRLGDSERIKRCASSIILSGGSHLFSGFPDVLYEKILSKLPLNPLTSLVEAKIFPNARDLDARFLAWKGGAVFSKLESTIEAWITEEEWQNFVKEAKNNTFEMLEIKEEEEIVNEQELIEELPTDSETETEEVETKSEQYENIAGIENFEGIIQFDDVDSIYNPKDEYENDEIEVVIPTESDNIEIELTGPCELKNEDDSYGTAAETDSCEITLENSHQQAHSSSDKFYDVLDDNYNDFTCSLQLTEPNFSQLLVDSIAPKISDEICRICARSNYNEVDSDNWLICYGCGEAFHRTCLKEKLRQIKCEMPLIYRNRLEGPDDDISKKFTHAPWFCNTCVKCFPCEGRKNLNEDSSKNIKLKDSFASCRHCGKITCLACYNSESGFSNNSVQLSRFSDLKNYSCPECLQCINCGLSARPPVIENRRKSISMAKQTVVLYDDLTLCRPCYLSNQNCCTCPRCSQIYHSLPDHYDFGEAPYDPDFSLCPMVSCDDCGSWTHCQCEGIDDEEYERLGSDKNAKFTCFNCKNPNKKKTKQAKSQKFEFPEIAFRLGNLMRTDDETVIFNFWHFDEPWKRQPYALTFKRRKFTLSELNGREKIEADSFSKLASKFTLKFRKSSDFESHSCLKAVNPHLFFNPMRWLTFLEPSGAFKHFCEYLRDEISTVEEFVCARTRPHKSLKDAFVKKTINENRRLSLTTLPEIKASPQVASTAAVNTGKMTVKFLYSQYIHTLKSDPEKSINTTNVHSCGLALRPSAISGFGLFATRTFQRNSLIIEYCGEMLTGEAMVNKRDAHYNALGKRYQQSCYLFRLDELKVLDATHKGNLSRFINHSCDPNCYSRVVQIDSSKKLLIFASKIIEAGEEIVYDYKFPDEEQKIPCLCGSEKCRKWMN